ncbi:MAG: hypothetical protein WCJ13_02955 [Coriobacteriia bacterium]
MRTRRLWISTVLGFALAATVAAPALGAPAATTAKPPLTTAPKSTTATAPKSASTSVPVDASAGGPIDVQIWPGQGGKTAIITVVEVDAATKLPVTVRIPVIPGSTVEWAGQILGGAAESDLELPYTLVQGRGGQFAELTLTTSHRGQVDAIGFPLEMSGDKVSLAIDYVQSVSSPLTAISVRVPANVSQVKITPKPSGDPIANVDGESLYAINPSSYKPGEKQLITVFYSTVPPVEPAPGAQLNQVLIGLAIALAIAVVVIIVLIQRQSSGGQVAEEFDDEDESEPDASAGAST